MTAKLYSSFIYRLKMLLADRQLLLSMLVIPLLLAAIGGYALKKERDGEFTVFVVDEDSSQYSDKFINALSEAGGLIVQKGTAAKAAAVVRQGRAEAIFIIPDSFEDNIKNGNFDSAVRIVLSPYTSALGFLQEVSASIVMELAAKELSKDLIRESFAELGKVFDKGTEREIEQYFDAFLKPVPPMKLDYKEIGKRETAAGRSLIPLGSVTVGLIPVFSMFYIMSGSEWLLEERRNGTLKRLIACPSGMRIAYAGSALALFAAGMLQALLYILLTALFSGGLLFSALGSFALLVVYLAAAVGLCMLLAAIFPTAGRLQSFAPFFVLATGFLGGCFWNYGDMPLPLKKLALVTLQGWLLEGVHRFEMLAGGALQLIQPFLVLTLAALILFVLSYKIVSVKTY